MNEQSKKARAGRRAVEQLAGDEYAAALDAVESSGPKVRAIAIVRAPGGYSVVELDLPAELVDKYATARTTPDHRGFAFERAVQMLERG